MATLTSRDFEIDALGRLISRHPSICSEPGDTQARCSTAKRPCDAYCARHCRIHRKHGHTCTRTRLAAYMRIYMRTYKQPNPAVSEVAA